MPSEDSDQTVQCANDLNFHWVHISEGMCSYIATQFMIANSASDWYPHNIFLFLHENICCGYSLEAPRQGASNEYPQHVFVAN